MIDIIERVWDFEAAGMMAYADWYLVDTYASADDAREHFREAFVQDVSTSDGEAISLRHDFFIVDADTGRILFRTSADAEDEPEEQGTPNRIRRLYKKPPLPEEVLAWP